MIASINSGSSSIKFAFFEAANPLVRLSYGEMKSVDTAKATLMFINAVSGEKSDLSVALTHPLHAETFLIDFLSTHHDFRTLRAIGHRVVHGMQRHDPESVTPGLLKYLKEIMVYDPEHLPQEIRLIELIASRYPAIQQVACFDTAFHAGIPVVAKMLAIPRRYYSKGIQRYGFHGLSYAYLMEELHSLAGKDVTQGKIILAHLGSGASLAAVSAGRCIDTSMGFTPSSGLIMGTRTGDLDPGVATYLMQKEKLSTTAYSHLINHESGLLGVSETSSDMRELLAHRLTDNRAAQAVELFCYQARKWIGSFAAALDGLDTLVFAGGIGENAPEIRSCVCERMTFLGIELDDVKNKNNEATISSSASKVDVRIINTNEELMIARLVYRLINNR